MENIEGSLDIFATIRELNMPADQYIVFGSGPLTARGLRESKDIDLLVTPELFEALKARGWHADAVEIEGRRRERISHGTCEAFKEFWVAGNDYDVRVLISEADIINGVRFMRLNEVTALKQAMGREKDLRDIRLIEEYLKSHPDER